MDRVKRAHLKRGVDQSQLKGCSERIKALVLLADEAHDLREPKLLMNPFFSVHALFRSALQQVEAFSGERNTTLLV